MKRVHSLLAMGLGGLLLACLIAAYLTRDSRPSSSRTTPRSGNRIDQGLFQSAQQLSTLADSREERAFSRDALRLADHELDQAFASALRDAAAASTPKSGPLKDLADRIEGWNQKVAADQDHIAKLTAQGSAAPAGQLDLAKAQLELDQDELEDAHQDLVRQGGDQRSRIQRQIQQHETAEHQTAPPSNSSNASGTATLSDQARVWFALRDRRRQVEAAREQAANHGSTLDKQHDALEAAASPASDAEATVAGLQHLADQRKSLADFDRRIQDTQQLTDVYTRWTAAIEARQTGVLHLLFYSFGLVLAILLVAVLIDRAIRRTFQTRGDPRRFYRMQVITTITVQLLAAILIALVIFGPPNQVSTLIGLVTAGLTVALRDFIIAFLGWFALMGRNGIRIGDWVEIKGVGGEVVEIGLLKTVLLEVGESGGTGQPTGRRVSFMNGFAIEGHYFNFSTAGQWLWDELQVTLPSSSDPYQLAQQIHEIVEQETLPDSSEAEKDWERVTHRYGTRSFSAKPVAELRPSGSGFDVTVRYLTRAPQRYEVKSRLFKAIVDLLHKPAGVEVTPTR